MSYIPKICKHCGASLDSGETCDCLVEEKILDFYSAKKEQNKSERKSESIIVGFDISTEKNVLSKASVVRYTNGKVTIANTLYGNDAENLYDYLIFKKGKL